MNTETESRTIDIDADSLSSISHSDWQLIGRVAQRIANDSIVYALGHGLLEQVRQSVIDSLTVEHSYIQRDADGQITGAFKIRSH